MNSAQKMSAQGGFETSLSFPRLDRPGGFHGQFLNAHRSVFHFQLHFL